MRNVPPGIHSMSGNGAGPGAVCGEVSMCSGTLRLPFYIRHSPFHRTHPVPSKVSTSPVSSRAFFEVFTRSEGVTTWSTICRRLTQRSAAVRCRPPAVAHCPSARVIETETVAGLLRKTAVSTRCPSDRTPFRSAPSSDLGDEPTSALCPESGRRLFRSRGSSARTDRCREGAPRRR